MKNLKILGFVVVALLVVALTGCDAILETFFPAFGERGDDSGGNNAVGVYVEIVIPETIDDPPPIKAIMEDAWTFEQIDLQVIYSPAYNWDENGNTILSGFLEFYNVPKGEYTIVVWLESSTDNDWYDWDEPWDFAVWFPTGNSEEWDNIFRFPNENDSNWIDGEAILNFEVGGEIINYDFHVDGPFLLDIDEWGANNEAQYTVFSADSNNTFFAIDWVLLDSDEFFLDGDFKFLTESDNTQDFKVRFDSLSLDELETDGGADLWLEVLVTYDDFGEEMKRYPVYIGDEASLFTTFDITLNIRQLGSDPLFLDNGDSFDLQVSRFDSSGFLLDEWNPNVTVDSGKIDISDSNWLYNPDPFYDWVVVIIDYNQDGDFGPDYDSGEPPDFYLEVPVALAQRHILGGLTINYDARHLKPLFLFPITSP